jgi:hypothetical protein
MYRVAVILLLSLAACATQSQEAFSPRSAAAPEVHVVTPNMAAERDAHLAAALDRILEQQEEYDQTHPNGAPASHDGKDLVQSAQAQRDPVAVQQ